MSGKGFVISWGADEKPATRPGGREPPAGRKSLGGKSLKIKW